MKRSFSSLGRWLLVPAIGLGVEGCISSGRGGSGFGSSGARAAAVTVEIDNRAWSDMRIFVQRGGSSDRHRLGMVGSMRKGRFRIPGDLYDVQGTIEIIAIPIGGEDRHRSGTLPVEPGTVIMMLLNNRPSLSQVRVRS